MKGKRVVILSLVEHLGDIIASEPLIREIVYKEKKPFVVFVVNKKYSDVLIGNQMIDYIVKVECLSDWITLKKFVRRYFPVYDMHIHKKVCTATNKKLYNPNNFDINFDNYFNFGSLLDVFSLCVNMNRKDITPRYYIPHGTKLTFDTAKDYVVIQSTSNLNVKKWTDEKWVELIERISFNYNLEVYEVGLHSNLKLETSNYTNLCGKISINEISLLIKNANLFIGIDSSFCHLANALNIPFISLLGKYFNFDKYCPYSGIESDPENKRIIQNNGPCSEIEVDLVYDSIAEILTREKVI